MNDNWGFSDEDLDGIFRQAAEGQRPRFEPEDWRQMAARLDAAGSGGTTSPSGLPWYKRWGWMVLVGLVLLTSLTVWLVTNPENEAFSRRGTTVASRPAIIPTERSASIRSGVTATTPVRGGAKPTDQNRKIVADGSAENEPASTPDRSAKPEAAAVIPADRPVEKGLVNKTAAETKPAVAGPAPTAVPRSEYVPGAKFAGGEQKSGPDALVTGGKVVAPQEGNSRNTGFRTKTEGASPERIASVSASTRRRTAPAQNRVALGNRPLTKLNQETHSAGQMELAARRTVPERSAEIQTRQVTSDGQRVSTPPSETEPEAPTDRWVTENLTALSTRRVSLRTINLPVEEPSLSQFSAHYTPPVRRAEVPPRGRLGVRAVLAPDLNAVSAMRTFAYGRSLGLLAEYEVVPRWRVQVGAIRSQKDYGSTPADYTPPTAGYWMRYGKPETIDARCAILDIPLNVRFDALRRPRHDLFVSAGLSTYVMLDEFYDYNYQYKPTYTHTVHRGGRHLASTLNLSVGYERQLGSGFSLQVEPYLKLPLAGVGWGSVRLYSTGLHLSLGFHQLNR